MIKDKFNIKEVNDKKLWEGFNLSVVYPAYFQSWNWGEVQKQKGIDVARFGLFRGGELFGIFQAFEIKAKRGHFIHVRHGPVMREWNVEKASKVIDFLKILAKERGASFIRISPLLEESSKNQLILKELGFRDSPTRNLDAENRWILNLNNNIVEIFSNMRKTTRYLIRKSEASNIKITRSTKISDVDIFYSIYNQTAKYKKFIPHELVREEFEEFGEDKNAVLYFASSKGTMFGAAMIVYYGREAIYRHGATSVEGRKTPASYLLQWEAIRDGKKAGSEVYNFWGIAKDDNPSDPWYGLSQFKKGFGGKQLNFTHSMDLPLKPTYWVSYFIDYLTIIQKTHFSSFR